MLGTCCEYLRLSLAAGIRKKFGKKPANEGLRMGPASEQMLQTFLAALRISCGKHYCLTSFLYGHLSSLK